ncbi:hypothetical protein GCM10007304_06430 [Rhodococcoides trifolii]|uniref:BioF2-like acetyltransferase domain-containing protein n=1 Tax=Rhodococcoides trifolii TaxID=908250 RepID=A0A917FP37_9NOCA|nr:GNAT family N-acetyltransferase [Rhodococcus trifolii]GGF95282.1 hypothetical protein GCM10007304_06430 [Rhodococcus trifolii]
MSDGNESDTDATVRFHHEVDAGLAAEWADLAGRAGGHVSSRPDYARGAVAIRKPRRPLVVTVHRGTRLAAVAPFAVRRFGPFRLARLTGDDFGMINEIVAEDDAAADALWSALAAHRVAVFLGAMDERNRALRRLREKTDWASSCEVGHVVTVVDVPATGPGAIGLRSRGSRRRLRATRHRHVEAGTPLAVEFLTTAAELDDRWNDMVRLSAIGVAGHPRTDFLAPPLGDFVRPVLQREAEAGRLVVVTLAVGGTSAAQLLMIRSGHTLEGWLTHFDPAFSEVQPGHQMMEALVDHARATGVDTIDLGIGPTGFKKAWGTREYASLTVTSMPPGTHGARYLLPVARRAATVTPKSIVRRILRR